MAVATGQDILAADIGPFLAPSGIIFIWLDLVANIPAGWVICDGANSTPNLHDRYPRGVATAATNPGTTGGQDTITGAGHDHNFGSSSDVVLAYYAFEEVAIDGTSLAGLEDEQDAMSCNPPHWHVPFIMKT